MYGSEVGAHNVVGAHNEVLALYPLCTSRATSLHPGILLVGPAL